MAKSKDIDVRIQLNTAYDGQGAKEAEQSIEELQQAAEEAASPMQSAGNDSAAEAAEMLTQMGKAGKEAFDVVQEGAEKSARTLRDETDDVDKLTAALEAAGKGGEKIDLSAGVGEQREALAAVAETNFKKKRRKTAGRPDSHRAY